MALILRPPGSRESLTDALADLGRTRKTVAVAAGLFSLVAVVLGCAAFACILDAGFHLPPLARAFALVVTLALGGVIWFRGVSRALGLRTDPLSVALELEERYPVLNDALASAVSFLDGPDAEARGVSNRLEAAAVRSAQRLADRHEFGRLVPSGACWRAVWACGLVFAVTVPLILVDSGRAATALVRFADPFGVHPWPTKTRIEILAPEQLPVRIPKGEPFELKFAVRGVIKDRATVTFRLGGADEFEEHYPLAVGNDPKHSAAAVVTAKIDPNRLPGPFTFKIVSNDYDTGWQHVEVVPPPRLMPLDGRPTPQFRVTPPAYTGLPAVDLPDGAVVLELPVGTAVSMRAATDVRLSAAGLAFLGDKSAVERAAPLTTIGHLMPFPAAGAMPLAEAIASDIPLSLDPTGRVISGAFRPAMSGMYALKLTDETGLTGTRLIEIRLTPDPAPIVVLHRPAAGKDPALLTPAAVVPVSVSADDKQYAVRRTFLEYRVGRDGAVRTILLSDARHAAHLLPAVAGGLTVTARVRPTSTESRRLIPVSEFKRDDGTPVRDGDLLLIVGAADDWDDVTPAKDPGRSSGEVEILIAAPDAIEAWLQRELAAMRPDLVRLRDQQRDARHKTAEAAPLPDGTLIPADRERLLAAEQLQRQIRGKVGDARDGLRARADALRETVRANSLPKSNTTDRVERVADELDRISERDLLVIEPNLSDARQVGSQPPRPGQEQVVPDLLKRAGRHQKAVEDGLTNLLDLLAVWGGASEIRGEARVLRDLLTRLAGETDKLSERVPPGKPVGELTTGQRADLDRAATKTEQAAEQAGSLLARAARLADEKDRQAAEARTAAKERDRQADAVRAKAEALPPGTPEKSALNARANALKTEADALRAVADKAAAEAAALRKGIQEAGGQTLPDEVRKAADAIRNNQQGSGANLQRSAAARLDRLVAALTEKQPDTAPDLEKWKKSADDLDALAGAQDDLRKRAADAAKISDPVKREAELKRLAAEQDKLIERGRELLQRLTRERADAAARDARDALDRMQTARDDLERGNPGTRPQSEAVDKLDQARDRLDAATANPAERLSDEKRRKMADKVNALLERQKAAVAEAERIHKLAAGEREWKRPVQTSYAKLAETERNLAAEVETLQKEFEPLPVLARILSEATGAMKSAGDRITVRLGVIDPALVFDAELEAANDRKVSRPMGLALRRLEQLHEALKQEDPKSGPKKEPGAKSQTNPKGPMTPPQPPGGGNQDIVPPLAQLKVLRALQAELNQLTAEFAKAHPNPAKLTDEEREELKELEAAQRDIAALFEQMAKLFEEHKLPKPEKPEPEKMP
jgi:hypothetical protein